VALGLGGAGNWCTELRQRPTEIEQAEELRAD
jgi:hypothetical protein